MEKPKNLIAFSPAEVISPRTGRTDLVTAARSRLAIPFALILSPALLLAFAVRVINAGGNDLGLDEAISFFIASKPPLGIVTYTLGAIWEHPPGYYLLLHFWMQLFGSSEWSLHALSAMGGVLSTALVATLAQRWFGRRVAMIAMLLTALQPLMVYMGRNARMYAWLYAAGLLSVYLFDRALTRNRWLDWLAFIGATLLGVALHYLAGVAVLAYALFVILRWRQVGPGRRPFLGILLALGCLTTLWVLLASGPRASLLTQLQRALANPWTPSRLSTIYIEWALGSAMDNLARSEVLIRSVLPWLVFFIGILIMPQPRRWKRGDLQVLILGLVLIPPVVGSLLFAIVASRHHSVMLGLFVLGAALGIEGLWQRRRLAGAVALVLLVGLDAWHVNGQFGVGWHPYSEPMTYIEERARAGEQIVTTYFFDWPLDQYYNRAKLPSMAIPGDEKEISLADARIRAAAVVKQNASFWLMLYPSVVHPERVEQAFNQAAFPADKVWFPGTRGVVHFYGPRPMIDGPAGQSWDTISLVGWQHSSADVAAGDAVRLQFEWQRNATPPRALVALRLAGPDDSIWASRVSEPCNGTCITSDWPTGRVLDRAAFAVPADVPPGDYTLRIAWLTPEGTPLLGKENDAGPGQVDLPLLKVRVLAPAAGLVAPPAGEIRQVPFGQGLALYAAPAVDTTLRAGSTVDVTTQWTVSAPQPELTGTLHLQHGSTVVTVAQPLGPAWYSSGAWQPGRIVRAQQRFALPGELAPAVYQASLAVAGPDGRERPGQVALGTVTIEDRPHSFSLPSSGTAVDAAWTENIRLARVTVPDSATAGDTVHLTLAWHAGGPADRNWKIFIHLLAPDGQTAAQVDGYPAEDQAPANTWQRGEVILDGHDLALPPDLAAGAHRIEIGFYDEKTNERLARPDGSASLILAAPLVITR